MQYSDKKFGELIVKDDLTHGEFKRWGSRIDFDVHGPRHRGSVLKAAVAIGIIEEPELTPKQIASLSGHHVRFMGNHLVDIYNDLVEGVKLDDPDCSIDWQLQEEITQGELEVWVSQFRFDSLAEKNEAVFRESIVLGAILADILIKPIFKVDRDKYFSLEEHARATKEKMDRQPRVKEAARKYREALGKFEKVKQDLFRQIDAMPSKQLTWLFMNLLQEYDMYNATPEEDQILDEPEKDLKV